MQRVTEARVTVGDARVAAIGAGLLVLVGVERNDADSDAARLAERIAGYRVFADEAGRMNRSLADTGFGLLLVPQFTLAADTKKGTRASFTKAADPETGRRLFASLVGHCRQRLAEVACGEFGAHMQVALVNDGPVTFWLET